MGAQLEIYSGLKIRERGKGGRGREKEMSENGEFFGMEKADTYFGTWNGIRDWNAYTGEEI